MKGKKYVKKSCHATKGAAKAEQKTLHAKGYTARVVKDKETGKHCIFSAGKKKTAKKKK